ncbi:MAG: hypothetical protein KDA46_14535 [Parvularculaceae bacterium]|nr:hypothetical protein [Parvularculaceae bacterium]
MGAPAIFSPRTQDAANAAATQRSPRQSKLEATSEEFESAFIAEMLRHAGFEKAVVGDGGPGASAMAGFVVDAVARDIARAGGFGLAEVIAGRMNGDLEKNEN